MLQYGSRQGFIFTMAIMFGMAILGIAAFLAILNIFIGIIAPTIPDILTDVPTLYDYDEFGKRIETIDFSEIDSSQLTEELNAMQLQIHEFENSMNEALKNNDWTRYDELKTQRDALNHSIDNLDFGLLVQPNQRLVLYWFFAVPAIIALFVFIMFSAASYYWEKAFSIFKKGTSIDILKTSVLGIIIIILVPEFWDTYAITMKEISLYLLDPFNGHPHITTERLWCKLGCIVDVNELLNQDAWEIALASPNNFGQELLVNALLPLFKAIPVASLSITLFVIAKIRVLFIMIVLISLPLWMVAMNLPILKKHANDMVSNMIGASIAPIFSALTLFVGLTFIDSTPIPALEEWVSVLGIGILASVWPIILAPKLSIISSQATSMTQTLMQSGAMFAATSTGGMGSGMMQSGAMPGTPGLEMSRGQQAKTLLASGLVSGSMSGAQQITPMNIPNHARQGIMETANKNMAMDNVSHQMAKVDASNPNIVDPQISNGFMHNPGNHLNAMENMQAGEKMVSSPEQFDNVVASHVSKLPVSEQKYAKSLVEDRVKQFPAGFVD